MQSSIKPKFEKIQKRDGRIVDFDKSKITSAVHKALTATGQGNGPTAKKVTNRIISLLNRRFRKNEIPLVEQVQDIVEEVLILENLVETARAYILYREQRRRIREAQSTLDETVEMVDKYIQELDWQIKENSNMAYSLQGLHHYVTSAVSKKYWLNKIYPKEVREAADSGDFHIHNLDFLGPYCCGWDLYDLLNRGFGGVMGKVESRPPKHFRTALGQLVNFFYTLQGESAGANAVSNFDTLLAPFIRYDALNYQQVKQAMQEFIFNCAIPTRVGFQTPFLNVTLDINPPGNLAHQPVIVGGVAQKETYGDFQEEMNIFNRAFAEVMTEGDAKGRVFTFPIPTYNITKDFDWDNPALAGVWEMTAKYGVPYFANFVNSDMNPDDARSMCLHPSEEVLVKNNSNLKRLSMDELIQKYIKGDFDKEGWADCDKSKNLKMLSLNPQTLKLEWADINSFLKVKDSYLVQIKTEDGKVSRLSRAHIVPILTPQGIVNKKAQDIKIGDYLINLKNASELLNSKYQNLTEGIVLDEKLAKILGYFTADGNYLFESRKNLKTYGLARGLQFSFKSGDQKNISAIKKLLKERLGCTVEEKQDPRYNTYYLYVYNTNLARQLYDAGFEKYGRLPQIIFNSPLTVIKSFLEFYFKGDGYKVRQEIHLNDEALARDLVLLYSLIGQPVVYRLRKRSQVIYLQHSSGKFKEDKRLNNPIISERLPGFLAFSTYRVPGLTKSRMVGLAALKKYQAETLVSNLIKNSDVYIVRVKSVEKTKLTKPQEFYDVELNTNHLFVHSLGTVTHNCCRLRLDNRELYKRGGGLFGSYPLTGSIGVVTINLPRLGYLSKTKKELFSRLERVMDLAKISLEVKRKILDNFIEKGLYPYSKHYLESIRKMRDSYWSNHFSTIGLVGMNELLANFMDKDITAAAGRKLAEEILVFMRDRLVQYQEETGNLYNLEATPAESTSYRLAKKDKELYPDIIAAGQTEPYYTNSSQLPVGFTHDLFEALDLQDNLQTKYTGGTVLHAFLGERLNNQETVKNLIKKAFGKYRLPYLTLTPTFSICPNHGYLAGEYFTCPKCLIAQPCEVYSRVVGYIRPVQQWHLGKQEEFKERVVFRVREKIPAVEVTKLTATAK